MGDVFYGTDYHSHLGTRRGGMAFHNGEQFVRSIHSLENAYFRNKFEPDLYRFKNSKIGIGIISDSESQPITLTSHLGRFSIVTVGRVENVDQLTAELVDKRINFAEMSGSEINPTELVAIIVSLSNSFKEGIELVQEKVKGSCSFLIMTDKGIYASRDKLGRTSVIIGKNEDGYTAATESSALVNLGYKPVCELGPGETVFISAEVLDKVTPARKQMQICSFLWVYYGYPSSYYEGINVEATRYECGCALANRDRALNDVDLVAGIPDSGIGHAVGYSNCKHIPYKRAFVKYTPTWPRSFMPKDQAMRSLVAKMKLIPNKTFIKDKNLVLMDDSMVRGTQLKDNIVKLVEAGSKDIHVRLACPPIIFPCDFLNFSTSRSELNLIARKIIEELEGSDNVADSVLEEYANPESEKYANMIEHLRKKIGAETLRFQRLDDLVRAIGLPKEKLCTHCWDNSSYF